MRGPPPSEERLKFERDLPVIEQRMRHERVTLAQLGREYGLSLAAVKKIVRLTGHGKRLAAAREACRRREDAVRQRERSRYSMRLARKREERQKIIRQALAEGKPRVEIARILGMDLGNLSRFMKQHPQDDP